MNRAVINPTDRSLWTAAQTRPSHHVTDQDNL